MATKKKKVLIIAGIVIALIISISSITIWTAFQTNNNDIIDGHLMGPDIFFDHSHSLGKYKLIVVSIYSDGPYDRWVGINNITYLVTDYIPHPHVYGGPEPARSILDDKNNKSNLASGSVSDIKFNIEDKVDGNVTFYDLDNNDLISIGDEFVINADIIPINAVNGVDFYLIYDAEFFKDKPIFDVIGGTFIGEYTEYVEFAIDKQDDIYNITIMDIDALFFQDKTISKLSIRIYSKITDSTLFWQNLNESLNNESSLVIFYDNDFNNILTFPDNLIITDESLEDFIFMIYHEYMGTKIGIIEY